MSEVFQRDCFYRRVAFGLQIYPDEGHFLHSDGARQHLSQSLVNFFEECFRKPEKREDGEDENDS